MPNTYEISHICIALLRLNAEKGWHVKGSGDISNPRIGSAYRDVDYIQSIAIGWASR